MEQKISSLLTCELRVDRVELFVSDMHQDILWGRLLTVFLEENDENSQHKFNRDGDRGQLRSWPDHLLVVFLPEFRKIPLRLQWSPIRLQLAFRSPRLVE